MDRRIPFGGQHFTPAFLRDFRPATQEVVPSRTGPARNRVVTRERSMSGVMSHRRAACFISLVDRLHPSFLWSWQAGRRRSTDLATAETAYQPCHRTQRNYDCFADQCFAVPLIVRSGTTVQFLFRLLCRWFRYARGNHKRRLEDPEYSWRNIRPSISAQRSVVSNKPLCKRGSARDQDLLLLCSEPSAGTAVWPQRCNTLRAVSVSSAQSGR